MAYDLRSRLGKLEHRGGPQLVEPVVLRAGFCKQVPASPSLILFLRILKEMPTIKGVKPEGERVRERNGSSQVRHFLSISISIFCLKRRGSI